MSVDNLRLNFNQDSLWILNIILALIMFGVALELKVEDFKRLLLTPKTAAVGIISQFVALPALTFLLINIIQPLPSVALGMMMVAACPGGNISNFMTHMAKGNTALSVSLTAFGTVLAIFMTPLNLQLWGSLYPPTANLLREVSLNAWDMLETIVLLAGIPLVLGMIAAHYKPTFASVVSRWLKPVSIIVFIAFVIVALSNNLDNFMNHIGLVVGIVFLHNLIALSSGFFLARWSGLNFVDQKTIAIETGIQNSGLGLFLIFSFFDGLGGMAIIAAWWGIWHVISGLTLATYWSYVSSPIQVR
jgi:bile acid:Na+ symporter, BASS family